MDDIKVLNKHLFSALKHKYYTGFKICRYLSIAEICFFRRFDIKFALKIS